MNVNTFCNICFTKGNIIKLCWEENKPLLNVLISLTSCPDAVNDIIYLCINCCNKLEEYGNFRELCLTNFVRFRYLYNEHKKHLEIYNAPDIEIKLKAFVDVNVERPSGTPLIETYEVAHTLRNDTKCNIELDEEVIRINSDEFVNKSHVPHADFCNTEYSTLEIYIKNENYDNDSINKDQEKNGCNVVVKNEPNPDVFEESQDPLVSDTVANVSPCRELTNHDTSDISFTPDDRVTDDSTNEEGSGHCEYKAVTIDTVCNVYKCNKTLTDSARLKIPKRLHSDTRDELKRLKLKHTDEKPLKCDECSLRFKRPYKLKIHKRVHTGEKPYKCDECDYRCAIPSNLKIHKSVHTGEKPFKCDECGMYFKRRFNLDRHKYIHTAEKPYKCDECGLGYSHESYLNRHKISHTGDKPYKCDECGVGFTQSCTLKTHKRIHSGEKPYKCDECDYSSISKSSLISHKRKHTGEKPYKCDECGFRFTHLCALKKHKLTHRQ